MYLWPVWQNSHVFLTVKYSIFFSFCLSSLFPFLSLFLHFFMSFLLSSFLISFSLLFFLYFSLSPFLHALGVLMLGLISVGLTSWVALWVWLHFVCCYWNDIQRLLKYSLPFSIAFLISSSYSCQQAVVQSEREWAQCNWEHCNFLVHTCRNIGARRKDRVYQLLQVCHFWRLGLENFENVSIFVKKTNSKQGRKELHFYKEILWHDPLLSCCFVN